MSHYVVARININDPQRYQQYSDGFMEIFQRFRGTILSVDENPTILEGAWSVTRTVLIEFPDKADLLAWYESDDYQALARHRFAASSADVVIIEGLQP